MQYVVIETLTGKARLVDSAEEAEEIMLIGAAEIAWACEEHGRCDGERYFAVPVPDKDFED